MRVDYSKSKIYRIVCNQTGHQYYGSTTTTLSRRLSKHVSNFNKWLEGKYAFTTSYTVLEAGDYDIVLVEELKDITNKEQLHAVERTYIENNECVNKNVPNRSHKETMAVWYQKNKEKVREQHALYRANNKEKEKERHALYRANNKEKLKDLYSKHYETNKERLNARRSEKISCEHCGSVVRRGNISIHYKSNKCKNARANS